MRRRRFLEAAVSVPFAPTSVCGAASRQAAPQRRTRVRPTDAGWPAADDWETLNRGVGGRLLRPQSPFEPCANVQQHCAEALANMKNPFYLGDQAALTQTSGWVDAWTSRPSAYAVAAENTTDVVAAVNFARIHDLRLVIKGGGHSYHGNSCAADALLIWTRRLRAITMHAAFVGANCEGSVAPAAAVSLGAGAMWIDAYDAVTTRGGRYVQGGGCTTVGVAGLIQGGGFGSHSKRYGIAAAGLLEAEVVTADGEVRVANARTNPDLFWSLKGGGGGTFGVVTRVTLRTRELPDFIGAAFGEVKASSDAAYCQLIAKAVELYGDALCNPHWGEQMTFRTDNTLRISMVFCGLSQQQAQETWAPWIAWVQKHPQCSFTSPLKILALPARRAWDADFFRQHAPRLIVEDQRPGAPKYHMLWAGDQAQAGQSLHGYQSAWLPASLLRPEQRSMLVDALFATTRHWDVSLHFNKGLAGAAEEDVAAARVTAMNPAVLDAFALAIIGAEGSSLFSGLPGASPDLATARRAAAGVSKAMSELLRVAPNAGSYVSECDFHEPAWQKSFWGSNYSKLLAVKQKYDPAGLFFVHHGVGSEAWSADGFTRLT